MPDLVKGASDVKENSARISTLIEIAPNSIN